MSSKIGKDFQKWSGDDIHYWTEKTLKTGKKQIKLKATTIAAADKEVHKTIDNTLKQKQ